MFVVKEVAVNPDSIVVAPLTDKVLDNVAAPVTPNVLDNVAAPDTAKVPVVWMFSAIVICVESSELIVVPTNFMAPSLMLPVPLGVIVTSPLVTPVVIALLFTSKLASNVLISLSVP